ncbi:hypothetical protein JVU11DRAFT_12 [Chiua virens]|nr:hypothetical protein JVU11DRAFT_12 [Chiua virens]
MSAEIPVAVIGIGCKFPGGSDNKDLYYQFLRNKGDGMVTPPRERWIHEEWYGGKDEPGKYHTTKLGFVNGIDQFDSLEFGISSKEAAYFDPAIRLTLEASHAALQDSGVDYRGSDTGVYFVGIGRCVSIRANRISFTFDLRGPSLTVDTACSGSATAMHLALSSIKLGEIDQALIVGANTIVNPEHTVSFSKLGVLSPTGSCKSFDASADGYARAEGIAAVLVKRLDRALADGDRIYSIIKGSAVNANGRERPIGSPRGSHQRRSSWSYMLLERWLGTLLKQTLLGRCSRKGADAQKPLRVGSVKSNIGHTEGCSFLASLVKVSMMLHHKEIIPNIRFTKANPKIDFPALKMQVQTKLEDISAEMAAADGVWVASISSYGVGGSNAHVVVESAETISDLSKSIAAPAEQMKPLYLFSLGSLTEPALRRWTDALASAYERETDDRILRSVARELGRQTRSYPNRAFAVGSSFDGSLNFSRPVLRNSNTSPKLCLLAEIYPTFLSSVQENDRILIENYGQGSMIERTGLFVPGVECKLPASGIALVDLVRSLGITYDFVVGHSIGEIAMGYASGHYDRETAVGIAVARAAAMTRAEGNGTMVALGVSVQKAKKMIRKVLSQAKTSSGLWIAWNQLSSSGHCGRDKVFAAKLRVTCAFHTPLMEPQEQVFKEQVAATPLSRGTKTPIARVMSTTDGKWLDRAMDVNYCWDNIRRPVLFGTAINKIISDAGTDGVRFLEIAPHPVLKAYLEQCGGEPISLIRRPNLKVPEQNTGEHYQLLEGIGNLLSTGFKNVDFDKLCVSPGGAVDFVDARLPEYPYNKSYCWQESGTGESERLRERPRPIASAHFRVNADSHPDLTGHIVFDAVLFPASGYVESILENGAMVVSNIAIHKPLVLNGPGSTPGHAGCVINGAKWEFRAATIPQFDNGAIVLDSVYASGTFSRVNPAYDEKVPRTFDVQAKLALSQGSVTGDEFYEAIPAAYRYQDHFRNYLKAVHEIDDEASVGGKAYLTYLEVPEDTPDVFGKGYTIHPGILDSITQCGLAMFINMETKQFDFNGVFLPVGIDAIRRWDSRDAPDLDSELKKGIWTYFIASTWASGGPYKSDYIIANSEGKVLFTIEGFEIARAPDTEPLLITDESREQRLTTTWQPKSFPSSLQSLSSPTSLRSIFGSLGRDAAVAGRRVIRVADVAKTSDIAAELDATLETLFDESGVVVEYVCISETPSEADKKTGTLRYPRAKSLVLESWNLGADSADTQLASFDVVVHQVDLAAVQVDIDSITNLVGSGGVALLSVIDSGVEVENDSVERLTLWTLVERFSISGSVVLASDFVDGRALLYAKIAQPTLCVPGGPFKTVVVHPFEHGKEGDLVEIVKYLSSEAELWITGNDNAAGIGALGIASCLIAESPEYPVYSLLFEDHSLDEAAREKIVHYLRKNVLLLEMHMKISKKASSWSVDSFTVVRKVKEMPIPAAGLTGASGTLAACFPPTLKASDVEIEVKALGIESGASSKSAMVFVGTVKSRGVAATGVDVGTKVVGIACQTPADTLVIPQDTVIPFPDGISAEDAAAVPVAFLSAWIALVARASISASSTVLVHDGASAVGSAAVQVAKRFNAKLFVTVGNQQEAYKLSSRLGIPASNIAIIGDLSFETSAWIRSGAMSQFDLFSMIPSGAPSSHILDINRFAAASPASLVPAISAILSSHASEAFDFRSRTVTMSAYNDTNHNDVDCLVIVPEVSPVVRVDPAGQLFDPRKSYILVGGCSELGVRMSEWMGHRGARHIFLTSRRGQKGLTKVDDMYIQGLRKTGVQVELIAANGIDKVKTAAVVAQAKEAGPIGGIFLMTLVLRDGKFSNMTQEAFDDVYQSKVAVLNTILSCCRSFDDRLYVVVLDCWIRVRQRWYLDRIVDQIPNGISMSLPPITDSGIFKRLVHATKGKANTTQLAKMGMTTAQVFNFVGDALIRTIAHYVPMLDIDKVPETLPSCEPRLYEHLLSKQYLSRGGTGANEGSDAETPASILAALLSMDVEQISDNALITSFGLDSLGATRYSNQLRSHLGIQVSQIELLGSMTITYSE